MQPNKPKDKTFDEIVTVLKEHFKQKSLLSAERFRFNRYNPKVSQPVAQDIAELKQCTANCEYGAKLDASLRDRLNNGTRFEACQRRLVSENDLAQAFEIALNMDSADS